MKKGDLAFFWHSNCKEPGLVGTMEIVQEHSPDCVPFPYSPFPLYPSHSFWTNLLRQDHNAQSIRRRPEIRLL